MKKQRKPGLKLPYGFRDFVEDRTGSGGIFRDWIQDKHGKAAPKEPFVSEEQCWAFAELVASSFVDEEEG